MSYRLCRVIDSIDFVRCRGLVSFKQEGTNLVLSNLGIYYTIIDLFKKGILLAYL